MSPNTPGLFERILFCTDFSENADFAFDYALDAACRRPGCVLHVLHVIPEPDAQFWKTYLYEVEGIDAKARRDIDEKIDRTYRPRVPPEVDFRVAFRIGRDYMKILEFAREQNVDLIIMGRQGHSALGSMLFGKVTEKVARKATCAVLIIPFDFEKRLQDNAERSPQHAP
ncbi:MAG: universal stress protein [Lentisphaeria bacterium]|nr:universal stress protein [Lentisphaeria bacterium]